MLFGTYRVTQDGVGCDGCMQQVLCLKRLKRRATAYEDEAGEKKPASFKLLPNTPQEDEDLAKTTTSRLLKYAS